MSEFLIKYKSLSDKFDLKGLVKEEKLRGGEERGRGVFRTNEREDERRFGHFDDLKRIILGEVRR